MKPQPYLTTVRHTRSSPLHNDFTYRSCAWLVDLDTDPVVARSWGLLPLVRFRAKDHLGEPGRSWRSNVIEFGDQHGFDLAAARIQVLTGACTFGHAFDPLTLYWCDMPHDRRLVIAEVRNTYGGRHCYLLRPDDHDLAHAEKRFYVSPFNDINGSYTLHVPVPRDTFAITVTLHRIDQRPFVATWHGHRPRTLTDRIRFALHAPLTAPLVSLRIRWQGIRLWGRRLPIQARPISHSQEGSS